MLRRFQGWLTLPWLLGALGAAAADNPVTATRDTLQQWVQTRQLISRTQAEWESERELLGQTQALFERELKAVAEQLGKISTNNSVADQERLKAEADLKKSQEVLEAARQLAARLEGEVRKLLPQLPQPLLLTAKPMIDRLPADSATTKAAATERLQTVVGLLNEIDKFNQSVTVMPEKQPNAKGEQVSVDTLYLGLGAAWFVDATGELAGSGRPGPQGWEWKLQPEIAPQVRDAIAIYRNQQSAAFVALPVVIQ